MPGRAPASPRQWDRFVRPLTWLHILLFYGALLPLVFGWQPWSVALFYSAGVLGLIRDVISDEPWTNWKAARVSAGATLLFMALVMFAFTVPRFR